VIGLLEAEICTKMLKKMSEKLRAKFPPLHLAAPWLKLATSMNLPKTFFNPKQAQEKANHSNNKKNKEKRKGEKKNSKVEKPIAVGHFLSKL